MEQEPAEAPCVGRAPRIEEKLLSRTRALVQSRGGGLQPKMHDLESASPGARCRLPFRMAWISAAMGSALHSCRPSLPLRLQGKSKRVSHKAQLEVAIKGKF